jgi:hypothetical protein
MFKFIINSNIKYYLIFLLISIAIALLMVECIFRVVTLSSGTGSGMASHKWSQQYWKPINKLGYRDLEIDFESKKPTVLFLGDSFTAGQGVALDKTFYYIYKTLKPDYYSVNLGKNGSSSKQELQNLNQFLAISKSNHKYLIHQYFGNDIEDYIIRKEVGKNKIYHFLGKHSEFINFINTRSYIKEFSKLYIESLEAAYDNPVILKQHLDDIKTIHNTARVSGMRVVFLAFPFLDSDISLSLSSKYISPLTKFFYENCKKGDIFIDVTPIAKEYPASERIVNFMDAHPSEKLHYRTAVLIDQALSDKEFSSPAVVYCKQ